MSDLRMDHIALTVESLRQAENFYGNLFNLQVLFREGVCEKCWLLLPSAGENDKGLPEDFEWRRTCLERNGLRLMLLLKTDEFAPFGRIDHVCLQACAEETGLLQKRAEDLGCPVERSGPGGMILEDPYGIRWKIVTSVLQKE